MSIIKTVCVSSLAALVLSGCLSGGGGGGGGAAAPGGGQGGGGQGGQTTSFASLVTTIFSNTSNTAEAMEINSLTITFDDLENEAAFDALLAP